jgi:hypothetical protein
MHLMVSDGSATRFSTVFFACLKFPCTVVIVMMITEPPAGMVGV